MSKTNITKVSNKLLTSITKNSTHLGLKFLLLIANRYSLVEEENKDFKFDIVENRSISYVHAQINFGKAVEDLGYTKQALYASLEKIAGFTIKLDKGFSTLIWKGSIKDGVLELVMDLAVFKLIIELNNRYTPLLPEEYTEVMGFKSKYTLQMYIYLKHIAGFDQMIPKRKIFNLEELNRLFETNYSEFKQIVKKIIIPVQEELKEKNSSLQFLYTANTIETYRKGRRPIGSITIDLIAPRSGAQTETTPKGDGAV